MTSATSNMVKTMYEQTKMLGAGESHVVATKIFKDENATSVFSVYDGVKPSHMVLDELCDWAEENGKQEVLRKITDLANDLSFMEEV